MPFIIYVTTIKKQKASTRLNIQETKLRIKFKILRFNFLIVAQLQKLSALYIKESKNLSPLTQLLLPRFRFLPLRLLPLCLLQYLLPLHFLGQ